MPQKKPEEGEDCKDLGGKKIRQKGRDSHTTDIFIKRGHLSKMASLRQSSAFSGVCLCCCVISLLLHTFFCVTSATDVIRFDQGGKTDGDDIYDILEDEQLMIADKKLTRHKAHAHALTNKPPALNLSLSKPPPPPSPYHPEPLQDPQNPHVATATHVPRTSFVATPTTHQTGYTTRARAEAQSKLEGELEEDFLIFSQDRWMVEEGEERRREEERDLARRVKRSTATDLGSGMSTVNVEVTTNIPWNPNFLDSSSQEYSNLTKDAELAIQTVLQSMPSTGTATFNGARQGSTVILFTVDFAPNDTDRVALATKMLQLQSLGLTYGNISYDVIGEPIIEDDSSVLRACTCYLCASYQLCVENNGTGNGTGNYTCQLKSSFLFDFGTNQGDATLEKNRKRLSIVERVPGGIPIAGVLERRVALSMNGLISFGRKFTSFSPRPLPRGNRQLLCGYWADLQLSSDDSKSNVWYHVYQKTDNTSAVDAAMLAKGKNRVELQTSRTDFNPTFMMVATFEQVPPDPSSSATNERVNFQMVVMTDGFTSYAMLIYVAGGMQWSESAGRPVTIGYLNVNLNIDLARPDQILGNTNTRGVWFFELGSVNENPERACLTWYDSQVASRSTNIQLEQSLRACPCNYIAILFSFVYEPYSLQDSVLCFMLSRLFGPHSKMCCYRLPGVLIRNRPLAGTFVLNHPDLNPADHYLLDELPKQQCCFQSNNCGKYYDVRPIGRCSRIRFFFIAFGRGDPHITTIDGNTFPFNAIGEFLLFKSPTFQLQARTCQATSKDGNLVDASIFCAFVAKGSNSTLQVELSRSGDRRMELSRISARGKTR
ncbi:hypothetical protein ACOMHN_051869 [Nucella lapillus]